MSKPDGGGEFWRRLARLDINCQFSNSTEDYKRFRVIETPEIVIPPMAQSAMATSGESEETPSDENNADCMQTTPIALPLDGNTTPIKGLGAVGGVRFCTLDCDTVIGIESGVGLYVDTYTPDADDPDASESGVSVNNSRFPYGVPRCQTTSVPVELVRVKQSELDCQKWLCSKQEVEFTIKRNGCHYWSYDLGLKGVSNFENNEVNCQGRILFPIVEPKELCACAPLYICKCNPCVNTIKLNHTDWFTTSGNSTGGSNGELNLNECKLAGFVSDMVVAGCGIAVCKDNRTITISLATSCESEEPEETRQVYVCGVSPINATPVINGNDTTYTVCLQYGDWLTSSGGTLNVATSKVDCYFNAGQNICLVKNGNGITINAKIPTPTPTETGIKGITLTGHDGVRVENQQITDGVYTADIYGTVYCFVGDWFCVSGGSSKKMVRLNTSKIQQVFERMAECVQVEINVNGVLEHNSDGTLRFNTSGGLCGLNTNLYY